MLVEAVAERIMGFLSDIGIEVHATTLVGETFLPGIRLEKGRLLVDHTRLTYVGDLLHEAGHVAVVPPEVRADLSGDAAADGRFDMTSVEIAVIPWSFAAAVAIDLDPRVVFHAGGYRGRSEGLLRTFALGVYPGVHVLQAAGMCATGARAEALGVAPYPHMLRWRRDAPDGAGG